MTPEAGTHLVSISGCTKLGHQNKTVINHSIWAQESPAWRALTTAADSQQLAFGCCVWPQHKSVLSLVVFGQFAGNLLTQCQ